MYMGFLEFKESQDYHKNCERVRERITIGNFRSPQDLYEEKLRNTDIATIIEGLKKHKVISKKKYRILYLWCVEGLTHAEIAKKINMSKSWVTKEIQSIREDCQKYILGQHGEIKELFDSIYAKAITTIPRHNRKDAGYAKHKICWPSDYLSKISKVGTWKKQKYILKTCCVNPEYFRLCFGDNLTKCTRCYDEYGKSTCSREVDN